MFQQKQKFQNSLLILVDAVCLVTAFLFASVVRLEFRPDPVNPTMNGVIANLWLVLVTYFCVYVFFNANQDFGRRDGYEELVYIVKVSAFVAGVIALVFFAAHKLEYLTRTVWAVTVLSNMILMYLGHMLVKQIVRKRRAMGEKQHMYLVTTRDRVGYILSQLKSAEELENTTIRIAIVDEDMRGMKVGGYPVVATLEDLMEDPRREVVDEVYMNVPYASGKSLEEYIEGFEEMGIPVKLNINMLEGKEGYSRCIDLLGDVPVVSFAPRFFDYNKLLMKRVIDIVGALVGLVITAVAAIFVVPAIKLESPGPAVFRQKRVGKNGRYFYIYKFRSMYQDAEERKAELMEKNEMKGQMFKMTDDPRVTKVGKFIRSTSIDELPQFWNILKGEMSLVGTRPPTVEEFKHYEPRHKRRLSMKPGLTGLWQVSGRSDIEDFEEVVRLDVEYIDNWNLQLDAKILLKTVVVIFKKVGAK
ncbi:sugar transferase [Pseudoflavonifractor sp. An85]|uniref:sugar transferase n=1 Tax=Pseudoflavonifractor sp. An85 TaxID=1965661 RepID=UPI000B3767F9|nr:sugar transferase [Pseudoflavonifractor sp. An85]OUN25724.1 hypothetical protein B5G37_02620 [Pseudoflavonifractor sp. An85]